MPRPSHECEAECIAATGDAILVIIDDEEYWIPKSHILDESEVWKNGDEGTLVITQWIAEQKELV